MSATPRLGDSNEISSSLVAQEPLPASSKCPFLEREPTVEGKQAKTEEFE